jgi:hypothetical protein
MNWSSDLKKLIDDHPILYAIFLTLAIWYGSYLLGQAVGETIANISNNL